MATTIEGRIAEALFGRLQTLVLSPVLPVLLPNEQKTPPGDHRYLRVQFVPNTADRVLIDSDGPHQHLGLLQVSVYWSKGRGEVEPRDVAGAVASHFPCDFKLDAGAFHVRITKRPDVRDMIVEDAAVQIPVMVSYEAWA
jgi:hypothetical protein